VATPRLVEWRNRIEQARQSLQDPHRADIKKLTNPPIAATAMRRWTTPGRLWSQMWWSLFSSGSVALRPSNGAHAHEHAETLKRGDGLAGS
jgi:hypothetical protein